MIYTGVWRTGDTVHETPKMVFSQHGEDFNLIWDPGIPTLPKKGPLHLHMTPATTLGLALHARSDYRSTRLWLPR